MSVDPKNQPWQGAVVSGANLDATTLGSGTSFPTTWDTGRLFFRTDTGIVYKNIGTEGTPSWGSIGADTRFGTGADGAIVSGDYTANELTIDPFDGADPKHVRHYTNIDIPSGHTLNVGNVSTSLFSSGSAYSPKRWWIYVSGTLTIDGTLNVKGRGGKGGSGGAGGTAGNAGNNISVADGGDGGNGSVGTAGGAGYDKDAGSSDGSSVGGGAGGTGGDGAGGSTGGDSGTPGAAVSDTATRTDATNALDLANFEVLETSFNGYLGQWGAGGNGGSGGSGGGGGRYQSGGTGTYSGAGGAGGAGGNGGAGGGSIVIIANNVTFGASGKIDCDGEEGLVSTDGTQGGVGDGVGTTGGSGGSGDGANGGNGNTSGNDHSGGGGGSGAYGGNGDGGFCALFSPTTISGTDQAKVTVLAGTTGNGGEDGATVFVLM